MSKVYFHFAIFSLMLFLSLLHPIKSQGQDQNIIVGDDWTYRQSCLSDAIDPPEDWAWDGTILLGGPYGIHAWNSDWDTTRVLAFLRNEGELIAGSFSPDGRWYVEAVGHRECSTGCTNTRNYTEFLQIYRLAEDNNRHAYRIPWSAQFSLSHHTLYDAEQPTWIDNNHVAYRDSGTKVVDVRDGSIEAWDGSYNIIRPTTLSPDFTRDFDYINSREHVIEAASGESIREISEAYLNWELLPKTTNGLWSPDSSYFLALRSVDEPDGYQQLLLHDRDGVFITHILTDDRLSFSGLFGYIMWSPDGHRFLYQFWDNSDTHIVDLDKHEIVNLCTRANFVWSPNGEFLVLNWDKRITVLDSNFNHYAISPPFLGYGVWFWRE